MHHKNLYADFDTLYAEQHRQLYAFVFSKTGDQWMSEEIVQRSFIRWWEMTVKNSNTGMDGKKALFLIAKGVLIDEKRREIAAGKLIAGFYEMQDTTNDNTQRLDSKDVQQLIDTAISQLPPKRRQIFEMSRMEEMSYQQIAHQLNISVSTVESQMVKALRTLKEQLNPYMENRTVTAVSLALMLSVCYGNLPDVLSLCKQ